MLNKIFNVFKIVVIVYSVIELMDRNMTAFLICLFVLLLLFCSDFLKKKLGYSNKLNLAIYIFVICSYLFGEINNLYNSVWYFDLVMHTYSSIIVCIISSYILKKISSDNNKKLFVLFTFSFSIMVAGIWEIVEFSIDRLFDKDMQKDSVITEVTSYLLLGDNKVSSNNIIVSANVNDVDLIESYGGYVDIGLYDTMEDMICAFIGTVIFIIIKIAKL